MLHALMLAAAVPATAAPATVPLVRLDPMDTERLIRGLHDAFGAKFLLHGVAGAERACAAQADCLTASDLTRQVDGASAPLPALLTRARVGGETPRYVVAIRSVRDISHGIRLTMSVLAVDDPRWRAASADIRGGLRAFGGQTFVTSRRFEGWRYPLPAEAGADPR